MKLWLVLYPLIVLGFTEKRHFLKLQTDCSAKYEQCQASLQEGMTAMVTICNQMGILSTSLGENQMEICRNSLRQCVKKMDLKTDEMRQGADDTLKKKKCEMKAGIPGIFPDVPCLSDATTSLANKVGVVPDEYSSMCPLGLEHECPHVCLCAENLQKVQHNHSLIDGYNTMLEFEVQFCQQAASSSDANIPEQCLISNVC